MVGTMDYSPVGPCDMDSGSSSSYQVASPSDNESMAAHHTNIMILKTEKSGHGGNREPFLTIVEQPQMNFRFRYKSEMGGTHGCLLGETTKSKQKTHPGVELHNYMGRARIKCRLVQCDRDEDHPHQLQTDDEPGEPQDIFGEVTQKGYKLCFPEMGIIYTAKKNVPGEIYKRQLSMRPELAHDDKAQKRLMEYSINKAKDINLNIVRLKFSAHHWETDELICPPVFSTAIHNLKSAETNELKICRMDRGAGSVRGNEEVYILVEKVNKKNIKVRVVELNEDGDTIWSADALFTQADVHHQFAIVFKTPAYRDPKTPHDVNVFVELFRPQDGRTSQRMAFTYKADPRFAQRKKRKANSSLSSFSSIEDSSGGSLKSVDLPLMLNALKTGTMDEPMISISVPQSVDPAAPAAMSEYMQNLVPQPASSVNLKEALYLREHQGVPTMAPPLLAPGGPAPPLATYTGHYNISSLDFNQGEFNKSDAIEKALRDGGVLNSSDFKDAVENFSSDPFAEYRNYLEASRLSEDHEPTFIPGISNVFHQFRPTGLTTDAAKKVPIKARVEYDEPERVIKREHYSASYTHHDGKKVNRVSDSDQLTSSDIIDVCVSEAMNNMVLDFCKMAKSDASDRNKRLTEILKNIMIPRLSNGDTFLQMLVGHQSSERLAMLAYIVRQVRELDLPELLNSQNHNGETLLHLAMQRHELTPHVALLVQSGCDPMLEDLEGNNALHVAVLHSQASCLKELLKVMTDHAQPHYNLNAYNNAKDTPLVIAAKYGNAECVKLLLGAGAIIRLDPSIRHPLHVAASGDHLRVLEILFQFMEKSEVDGVDQNGNTALQIVCSGTLRDHTLDIIRLLLQNGADITKKSGGNSCPLKLAAAEPRMLALLREYAGDSVVEIKSEPEDEPESADEDSSDEEECDQSAPYMLEVAAMLDKSGKWRELAHKLDCHHIMNWYENTMSPTRTIFNQHLECEKQLNPKVLARILEEIGEKEASQVVLRHIYNFK